MNTTDYQKVCDASIENGSKVAKDTQMAPEVTSSTEAAVPKSTCSNPLLTEASLADPQVETEWQIGGDLSGRGDTFSNYAHHGHDKGGQTVETNLQDVDGAVERPLGRESGAVPKPSFVADGQADTREEPQPPVESDESKPRRRGRPKGSKNKPKASEQSEKDRAEKKSRSTRRGRGPDRKPRRKRTSRDAARVLSNRSLSPNSDRIREARILALTQRVFRERSVTPESSTKKKTKKKINYVDELARDTVPEDKRQYGPISRKEATQGTESHLWREADRKEVQGIRDRLVFREVTEADKELLASAPPTRCHFVRVRKRDGKRKARLVADGSSQDLPSEETYSPNPNLAIIRSQFVHAAEHQWFEDGCDVTQAYLIADLPEPVAIRLPPEAVEEGENPVKIATKALYGLRQAPKAWGDHAAKVFVEKLKWEAVPREPGVFLKRDENGIVCALMVCYVDDIVVTAQSKETVEPAIQEAKDTFGATSMKVEITETPRGTRKIFDFLGLDVHIDFDRNGRKVQVKFSSERRVERILRKYGGDRIKGKDLPASQCHRDEWARAVAQDPTKKSKNLDRFQTATDLLDIVDCDAEVTEKESDDDFPYDLRAVVGDLIFLSVASRPDVMEPTLSCARCPYDHIKKRMLKRILGYLKAHPDMGPTWTTDS